MVSKSPVSQVKLSHVTKLLLQSSTVIWKQFNKGSDVMRINLVGVALGTVVLLTACERGPTTTIVDYQCGALAVTAEFNQTGAIFQVGEHRTLLQQDISASGARYTMPNKNLSSGPKAQKRS